MPLDILTTLAALSAISSLGAELIPGAKGKRETEQIGGPDEEDVQAMMAALREGERGAAYEGARTAAHMAGGRLSQMGATRGGTPGAVAGNIGAMLGRQLGGVEGRVAGEGARLRGMRRFESYYDPSGLEQFASITGRLASAVAPLSMADAIRESGGTPGAPEPYRLGSRPGFEGRPGALRSLDKFMQSEPLAGAAPVSTEGWSFPGERDPMAGLRGLGLGEITRPPMPFVPSVEEPMDPALWEEIIRMRGRSSRSRARFPAAQY